MDVSLEKRADTSEAIKVSGIVLMGDGARIIFANGAEAVLPMPVNAESFRLASSDARSKDSINALTLLIRSHLTECCPMANYPASWEQGHHNNPYER